MTEPSPTHPTPDERRRPRHRSRRRTLSVAGAAVALVASSSIGTAWAVTTFTDVPATHQFYDEIEEVADAGVVTGYSDGTFRPGDPVSRQVLAAMMSRGLGRSVGNDNSVNLTNAAKLAEVTAVTMYPPGATGGTGHIALDANVTFIASNTAACPCQVRAWIEKGNTRVSEVSVETLANLANEGGTVYANLAVNANVEVTSQKLYPLGSNTYTLVAEMVDADQTLITARGAINAVSTPFGA